MTVIPMLNVKTPIFLVILLIGGDKNTQDKDIRKALEYWEDYHEQKKI